MKHSTFHHMNPAYRPVTNIPVHFDLSICIMPWELPQLEAQLKKLSHALDLCTAATMTLRLSLLLSSKLISWEESSRSATESAKIFRDVLQSAVFSPRLSLVASEENSASVLGCVDVRRQHVRASDMHSWICWLDPDIDFSPSILKSAEDYILRSSARNIVLTPQTVRLWDETWDSIVHAAYRDCPLNFYSTFDPASDSHFHSTAVASAYSPVPSPKFAGGWFTIASAELLKLIDIPNALAPYGREDTFVMRVMKEFSQRGGICQQILMEDILVAPRREKPWTAEQDFKLRIAKEDFEQWSQFVLQREVETTVRRLLGKSSYVSASSTFPLSAIAADVGGSGTHAPCRLPQ